MHYTLAILTLLRIVSNIRVCRSCCYALVDVANNLNPIGILKIGDIKIDFTSVDMSGFRWRNISNGIEYNLEYEIRIDFRSQEGVLGYSCISSGKTIGVTTIDFSD